jgi:hypothetical protein
MIGGPGAFTAMQRFDQYEEFCFGPFDINKCTKDIAPTAGDRGQSIETILS